MTSTRRQMVHAGFWAAVALLGLGCSGQTDDPADAGTDTGGSGSGGSGSGGSTGSTGGSTGSTGGSTGAGTCLTDGQLVITDDTNYSFKSTITIKSVTVKDKTDLVFDWSAVTKDFFGRTIDPVKDIDMLLVSLWGMSEQDLADNLNKDNLPLKNNKGALTGWPTDNFTSERLLELDSFHNEVPVEEVWARFDTSTENYQYPQDKNTFMMTVASGTTAGKDSRMLGFFHVDPNAPDTTVALNNESTSMVWEAHLANNKQLLVPAGKADLTIDWKNMTTNAIGNPYDVSQITETVVAHYANLTLPDLETEFLYLEEKADGWWSGEVLSGTSVNFSTLKDKNDSAFPGIDATGVWLVALFCTSQCNNPAPWSITVIRPCG
jgi:hypothetical protein